MKIVARRIVALVIWALFAFLPLGLHRIFQKKTDWWIYPLFALPPVALAGLFLTGHVPVASLQFLSVMTVAPYFILVVSDGIELLAFGWKQDFMLIKNGGDHE